MFHIGRGAAAVVALLSILLRRSSALSCGPRPLAPVGSASAGASNRRIEDGAQRRNPQSRIGSGGAEALLAASLMTGLLVSTTSSPAALAAVPEVDYLTAPPPPPQAVRIDFTPGSDPKLDPRALAQTLYADRSGFIDAAREVRAAFEEIRSTLAPAFEDLAGAGSKVNISPPKDVRSAVREALSGRGTAVVNGEVWAVQVESEAGSLDVRVTSRLLPRIPFRSPPPAGYAKTTTTSDVTLEVPSAIPATPLTAAKGAVDEAAVDDGAPTLAQEIIAFLGRPFPFYDGLTNLQAAEIAAVPGTAAIYSISYQYYLSEVEREEEEAKRKLTERKAAKKAKEKKEKELAEAQEAKKASKDPVPAPVPTPVPAPRPAPPSLVPVKAGSSVIALKKTTATSSGTYPPSAVVVDGYQTVADRATETAGAAAKEEEEEEEKEKERKRRVAVRVLKKMMMPWKPFREL